MYNMINNIVKQRNISLGQNLKFSHYIRFLTIIVTILSHPHSVSSYYSVKISPIQKCITYIGLYERYIVYGLLYTIIGT